jgi:hypothetical protein
MTSKALFHCGNTAIKLHTLGICALSMNRLPKLTTSEDLLSFQFLIDDPVLEVFEGIYFNNRHMNWTGPVFAGFQFPILGLLTTFHAAHCDNERNKIYSLLGLSDDIETRKR